LVWALRERQVIPALAGGIYFAGFATTANIFMPIGTILGERLAYFSSAGLCLLAAGAWVWLLEYGRRESQDAKVGSPAGGRQQALSYALLALVLVAFGVRTIVRNLDWRDDFTLAISGVQAAPRSAKLHGFLGNSYVATGQYDLAARELEAALAIDPDYPDSLEALGLIELRWQNYPAAGWLLEKAYYTSDRKNMNYDSMAINLAVIYMETKHLDGAMTVLDKEIAEAPKYGRAWSSRALVHYQLGQTSAAGTDAQMALNLDAGNLQAQNLLRQINSPAPAQTSQR
jgi:tetratricopeptide (TPR) repeat protein